MSFLSVYLACGHAKHETFINFFIAKSCKIISIFSYSYIRQCDLEYVRCLLPTGCPLSFETGGTMGYNCCFFLNFVPLHIESPYNFGGTGPILGVKNTLQRVNRHAATI